MALRGLFWWIDRWRRSSAYVSMSLEQQGAYRNLLDEAWLRGGALPIDEDVLAKACGDARRWKAIRRVVLARFVKRADGYHNETLDEVLHQSTRRANKQRAWRGRRAGNDPGNGGGNDPGNAPGNGAGNAEDNAVTRAVTTPVTTPVLRIRI